MMLQLHVQGEIWISVLMLVQGSLEPEYSDCVFRHVGRDAREEESV